MCVAKVGFKFGISTSLDWQWTQIQQFSMSMFKCRQNQSTIIIVTKEKNLEKEKIILKNEIRNTEKIMLLYYLHQQNDQTVRE